MRFVQILAWATALCCAAATGQSIDPTPARATIGDPLDLVVLVRTTPDLGAARLDRSCVQAQVLDGNRLIDDRALAIDIGPADEEGQNRLHIRHAAAVVEPIVQTRVSLTCGANFTREFTVLSQAGSTVPGTQARAAKSRSQPRPATSAARPSKPVRAGAPAQQASSPSSPAPVDQPAALPADNTAAIAPRPAGSSDVDALARSVLRLFQAAGLDLQKSSQGLLDLRRPDPAASLALADSKYLMQEVQRLRSETQQSATAIASLHARVERAESDSWLHATWAVLAVIAGLITLVIAVRVAELVAPALLRRFSRRSGDTARSADKQVAQGSSIEQYLNDIGARAATTPIERAATPPAPPVPEAPPLTFDASELLLAPNSVGSAQTEDKPAGRPSQAIPQVNRWSRAEFGPPSLDHRRVRLHRDDIDKAIRDGYLGFALVMLEQLLHSGEGKHPWVLMRLLDVYRQLRQQDNHERVCAEIEALYSVRVPSYNAEPDHPEDDDTIEQLDEWPVLRVAWPGHNVSPVIAMHLLRGDRQANHTLAAFADLLFLHELAEIRDAQPELDTLPA